jgi:hypothetical protein
LVLVQDFAFDLAGLEDILRKRCQNGLGAQVEPQRFHAPDQAALPVADWREMLSPYALVPPKSWPFLQFMYVSCHSTHLMRILCFLFAAKARTISAFSAENKRANLCSRVGFAYLRILVWVVIETDTGRKLIVPKLIAAAPI